MAALPPSPVGPTPAECNAVLDLYLATGGPSSWRVSSGYRNAVRNSRECCGWYGVSCDARGNIITLNLMSNGLQGPLPSGDVLASLQSVTAVFLQGNSLIGSLAPLARMPALTEVSVRKNNFAGELAGELGQLKALTRVSASENSISSVSPNLATAPIVTLFLGNNSLTSFPPEIASSPTLRILHLNNNKFTTIPPSLALFKGDQCSLVSDPRVISSTPSSSNATLCAPIEFPSTSTCLNMYYNDLENGPSWTTTKLAFPTCPPITPSPNADSSTSGSGVSTGVAIAIALVVIALVTALAMVGVQFYRRQRLGHPASGNRGFSLSRAGMISSNGNGHSRKSGQFGVTSSLSATGTVGARSTHTHGHVTSDTGASTIVAIEDDPPTNAAAGGGPNLTAATLDEDDEFGLAQVRAALDDHPTRSRRWSLPLNLPHLLKRSGSNGSHHKKATAVLFRPQGAVSAASAGTGATTAGAAPGGTVSTTSAVNRLSVVGTGGGLFHPTGLAPSSGHNPQSTSANNPTVATVSNAGVRPFTANASTAPISSPLVNDPEALGANLPKAHARLLAHSRQRDDSALRLPSPQIALVSAPTTRALGPISWETDSQQVDALPPGVLALPPLVDSATTPSAAVAAGDGSSSKPESVAMASQHETSAPLSSRARCVSFALPSEDQPHAAPALSLTGEPVPAPVPELATPGSVLLGISQQHHPALLVTPATPTVPLVTEVGTPGVVDGVALVPAPPISQHPSIDASEASTSSSAASGISRLSRSNTAPAALLSSRFAGKYRSKGPAQAGAEEPAAVAMGAGAKGDQQSRDKQPPVPSIHFVSPSTLLGT